MREMRNACNILRKPEGSTSRSLENSKYRLKKNFKLDTKMDTMRVNVCVLRYSDS